MVKKLFTVFAVLSAILVMSGALFSAPVVNASNPHVTPTDTVTATPTPTPNSLKVNICHSAGQSGNYTSNTIDINSVNDCTGAAGHDGHSNDIIPSYTYGSCTYPGKNLDKVDYIANGCSAPTVTPTPTSGVTPTATPTPTGVVTPTPTNTPSNGGSTGGGDNQGDGLGCGSHDCNTHPGEGGSAPVQAVLGASTMAGTGTFENTLMNIMAVVGTIVLGAGLKSYAKEKNK